MFSTLLSAIELSISVTGSVWILLSFLLWSSEEKFGGVKVLSLLPNLDSRVAFIWQVIGLPLRSIGWSCYCVAI